MKLVVDVWSDVICPWCYIGKRRLEAAITRFSAAHAGVDVDVVYHAFELDPSAARTTDQVGVAPMLAKKYRKTLPEAEAMMARVTDAGRGEGLDLRFDRARTGNTLDAHRLLAYAATLDKQVALKERLMKAYFTDGEPIADRDALVRAATEVGLEEGACRAALEGDAFVKEVRGDEAEARKLGVTGVPFFVFGGVAAVGGAQPPEVLARGLEAALEARAKDATVGSAEGESCGVGGAGAC